MHDRRYVESAVASVKVKAHPDFRVCVTMPMKRRLGGGAFDNETEWIHGAMRRALTKVVDVSLDVRVVSYGKPDPALERVVAEFG